MSEFLFSMHTYLKDTSDNNSNNVVSSLRFLRISTENLDSSIRENSPIFRLRTVIEQLKSWMEQQNPAPAVLNSLFEIIERSVRQVNFYLPPSNYSTEYANIFKDLITPLYYKASESSKNSNNKVASLRLMAAILIRSPREFFDANFDSFITKRVLSHVSFFVF